MSLNQLIRQSDKTWHGVKLGQPDWSSHSHSLAFEATVVHEQGIRLYLILNGYWEPLDFELPAIEGGTGAWRRWIDTGLDSPGDIVPWETAVPLSVQTYRAASRSVVVLFEEIEGKEAS